MAPKKPQSSKRPSPAKLREELVAASRKAQAPVDPLGPESLKKLGIRVGAVLVGIWVIALLIQHWAAKAVAGALTLAVGALVFYALRTAKRSKAVADIVQGADSAEARKEALSRLDADFKKDDVAAVLAKANLQMQEDPRAAQKTLETLDLAKVPAAVADQARAQRAMIHLVFGETDEARALADKIDLARHKDRGRVELAAIVAEAWARSGQAKRAAELLGTFDPNDAAYAEAKPALLRSRAFAYAWSNNTKAMKQTLRALAQLNPQYLAGFITKKKSPMGVNPRGVHPLLEKEAFEMLARSGAVPRRVEFRRS